MSDRDLQRWTREVAEDPGAPSFLRLARAYRRQGRRDAARDVVIRGLERRPDHADAHSLLALIHVEQGDLERARDEWETVLALDPGHFEASRGLGFLALERDEMAAARRHLDAALRARPDDATVAQARQLVDRRTGTRPVGSAGSAPPPSAPNPARAFDSLRAEGPFLGALVLDDQGLVLAGALEDEPDATAELLGGLFHGVVDEARRTADLVRMGGWQGLTVECDRTTFHLSPLGDGALVVAAPPRTPAGWVVRVSALARKLADRFVEARP
jgi:tetratricopeptide (TPR) repeat protein